MTNEDDKDEFGENLNRYFILSRLPKHLPDPQCQARSVPGAVRKYRAYLEKHPEDGGAWEGLSYLYARMDGDDVHAAGIDTTELGDPEETDYAVLSYRAEQRALNLRPTSLELRSSLRMTLGNAISAYTRPFSAQGIVDLYSGPDEARRELLNLIEATLILIESSLGVWGAERLEWQVDRARVLSDLEQWSDAQKAWLVVQERLIDSTPATKYDWPQLVNPLTVHLSLFDCALHLGNFELAKNELGKAKRSNNGRSLPHQRLQLLRATAPLSAVEVFARQQADLALKKHQKAPEDAYLLQAANWFEEAGDVARARAALQEVLAGTGYGKIAAAERLERLNNLPPSDSGKLWLS